MSEAKSRQTQKEINEGRKLNLKLIMSSIVIVVVVVVVVVVVEVPTVTVQKTYFPRSPILYLKPSFLKRDICNMRSTIYLIEILIPFL
jgi:hypothetical protein